ncbi:helix-turn-helix domain-containing protein [Bacillus sp. PK3_68]|uniref:helix-turn-helix domain-containing protein n=1 Tax=Bacillus sp. PK3_68 TaxID=2027408 RepID=UPI000E75DABC|nr:helix-turn-helix domain-containing protein [Bacillus sp. PK3_68]RJS50086.1 hypothetical protein CJ483_22560 [Bacillus sp. PK3_68]
MTEEKKYYTTEEAAKMLNKSKATIYNYIQKGLLVPLPDHKWRMLNTRVFPKEQVEELARKQEKKLGLTTTEAAKFLGVSRSTLHKLVKEGTIPAVQGTYRGRQIFYINQIDLEQFAGENAAYLQSERLKRRHYYDKERNIAFFQKFSTKAGREARLVFDTGGRWAFLFPDTHEVKSYEEGIFKEELAPSYELNYGKQNTSPGFLKMILPAKHPLTMEFFDMVYQQYEISNLLLHFDPADYDTLNDVEIHLKKTVLKEVPEHLFRFLDRYVTKGSLLYDKEGYLFIETDIETLTISLPKNLKEKIKKEGEKEGISMQEVVLRILAERNWEE